MPLVAYQDFISIQHLRLDKHPSEDKGPLSLVAQGPLPAFREVVREFTSARKCSLINQVEKVVLHPILRYLSPHHSSKPSILLAHGFQDLTHDHIDY